MSQQLLNRRTLLKLGSSGAVAALTAAATAPLLAAAAANREQATFQNFSQTLGMTLEAISARILPTTDTPGAREAGAVWFIDALAAGPIAPMLPGLREGAAALDQASGGSFAALSESAQDAQLRAIENTGFFESMHMLTMAGTFTMSSYGGNRGEVGWDILGFERRHSWEWPFGYYDAQFNSTKESAQ